MLHDILPWVSILWPVLSLIAAWRFGGDWKCWSKYYPTILFTICVSLFVDILTYEHSLWYFRKAKFLSNHTFNVFWMEFVNFPFMIFIYLSRYPYKSRWFKQFAYMMAWVFFYITLEVIYVYGKALTYDHSWNIWWSSLIWFAMFPILRLHHTKPLWAWFTCVLITVFIIWQFRIPIASLK